MRPPPRCAEAAFWCVLVHMCNRCMLRTNTRLSIRTRTTVANCYTKSQLLCEYQANRSSVPLNVHVSLQRGLCAAPLVCVDPTVQIQYVCVIGLHISDICVNNLYINNICISEAQLLVNGDVHINNRCINNLHINKRFMIKLHNKKRVVSNVHINKICISNLHSKKRFISDLHINKRGVSNLRNSKRVVSNLHIDMLVLSNLRTCIATEGPLCGPPGVCRHNRANTICLCWWFTH